jgi:hypothetical protein
MMTDCEKAIRISRNLGGRARMRRLSLEVSHRLVAVSTRAIMASQEMVRFSPNGSMRMTAKTLKKIDYVAQTFAWMSQAGNRFGPQATEIAKKALRALHTDRAELGGLTELCEAFRAAKYKHERVLAESKPRAPKSIILLVNKWKAARISTEKELVSTGRIFANCLADQEHSKWHRRHLRKGHYEYWIISDCQGTPRCLLRVDPNSSTIDEVKGQKNKTAFDSYDAVVSFMIKRKLTSGHCGDLRNLGICDALVAATASSETNEMKWEFEGTLWRLCLAPGILVGQSADEAFMISSEFPDEECPYWISGQEDYWRQATIRSALRRACAMEPALAGACFSAFSSAKPVLLEDWFGLSKSN